MKKQLMDYFHVVDKGCSRNRVGLGILSGILAGGLAGLLLAPKSGEELRKDLRAQAEIGMDKVKEAAEKVRAFAEDKADTIKSKIEDAKDNVKDAAQEAKDKVKDKAADAADAVQHKAGEIKHDIKRA